MCVYVPRDSKENIVKQVAFKLCNAQWQQQCAQSNSVREKYVTRGLVTIYTLNYNQLPGHLTCLGKLEAH